MSLVEIYKEEREYWINVEKNSNNRLVIRTARSNISKCLSKLHKLHLYKNQEAELKKQQYPTLH